MPSMSGRCYQDEWEMPPRIDEDNRCPSLIVSTYTIRQL